MSDSSNAVFLSYASQDAAYAQRLADGMRSAGIHVWFDQSELRGGDAWDAMIRKRVKDCALFVPIISATTDARTEGYFRLEWKLAVDRSHLMSDDRCFIVPVVIDETNEGTARVPELFRVRQWMRVPDGVATPEFVRQIAHLLALAPSEIQSVLSAAVSHAIPAASADLTLANSASNARPSNSKALLVGLGSAVAVVGLASLFVFRGSEPSAEGTPNANRERATQAAREVFVPVSDSRQSTADRPLEGRSPANKEPRITRTTLPSTNKRNKVESGQASDAPITGEAVQPLRLIQNAPLGPLEEPKHWGVQVELAFWDTIKTSAMLEDFEEYLRQYPEGRFAGLARNRIKAINAGKVKR